MMRYSARKKGGSEMSFVYHAFFRGHPIRSISQIDPTVWSLKSHSLESWRHQIHMWRDGFTVQDGPLQGFEIAANARLGAEMQLDPKRGVPRLRVAEAAAALWVAVVVAGLEERGWHTQPTLFAMMATAVMVRPMFEHCWEHVVAASSGT